MLIHPEVADALAAGRPVVALESTIISHGLPRPDNLRIAREIESSVRAGGAVPATVAVVDGQACVGLDDAALKRVANDESVVKVSVRELAAVAARRGVGATTVASTAHLAARAGIAVFATGGLGGVHRGATQTWDESSDLTTLSRTPVLVVCAGVKSILDVPATLERLETLNVGVLGYRTDRFPGFYLADSGFGLDWRVESPAEVADVLRARVELGTDVYGAVLANPIPPADELDRELHDRVLHTGLAAADAAGVRGKDVTPFLLDWFHRETDGASLAANVALVRNNAVLAAEVAAEYAPMTKIICVGDVMVDVLARLSEPLLTGSDTPAPISVLGGGSAANTAAWLGVTGADVTLVGRTGDDAYGRAQRVQLIASGVSLALGTDADGSTGTCIVLVDVDGERTMIPDTGANAGLTAADLPDERFVPGAHLHVSGYTLFGDARAAALRALELARGAGMTVSVGAASAGPLGTTGVEEFFGWIGSDLLLLANRDEAQVLTGTEDPAKAARLIAGRVGRAIVTCGRGPAVWCDGAEVVEAPVTRAEAVDSTGAGDAFAAGVISATTAGAAPADALRRGHELAARACAVVGGRPPIGGTSGAARSG